MSDTDWSVPPVKQLRVAGLSHAAPYLTNRLWGNKLTGEHGGHTSRLGWVAKPLAREGGIAEVPPTEISEDSSFYSTALDQLLFHSALLRGGLTASGQRVLSQESVRRMTTDQLSTMGRALADATFNSHARDKSNSGGATSPEFGVEAAGQGVALGMEVVTHPFKSKLAGSKGTFSSWGFHGTQCWSDPALELSVFVGTQMSPFWALPDLRQEAAGLIYGAMVPTAAAKHFRTGIEADAGGWTGQIMNMVMMMSMMGGTSMMGAMGGAAGGAPGAAAAGAGAGGGGGGVGVN